MLPVVTREGSTTDTITDSDACSPTVHSTESADRTPPPLLLRYTDRLPCRPVSELVLQVSCLCAGGSDRVLAAAKAAGMPLVLMSSSSGPDEVMKGIESGAVDFLETPVSQLKLRNIWQHVVRKVHFPHPPIPPLLSSNTHTMTSLTSCRAQNPACCGLALLNGALSAPLQMAALLRHQKLAVSPLILHLSFVQMMSADPGRDCRDKQEHSVNMVHLLFPSFPRLHLCHKM